MNLSFSRDFPRFRPDDQRLSHAPEVGAARWLKFWQLTGHSEIWPEIRAIGMEEREERMLPFLLSGKEESSRKGYF